jgi:hypothetical protein
MAEGRVSQHCSDTAISTRVELGRESEIVGELARRSASEDHINGESTSAPDALSDGQSSGSQNAGDGDLDVPARDHAVIHTALRVMVEHGGINSTDHQATRFGVSTSGDS